MHKFTILCNFALENLVENSSSYDRKIAIPYRAGTIPSSVVQFHLREQLFGSAVKPNRLVMFNFKLPISAYASGCVPKVEIKKRLNNRNIVNKTPCTMKHIGCTVVCQFLYFGACFLTLLLCFAFAAIIFQPL